MSAQLKLVETSLETSIEEASESQGWSFKIAGLHLRATVYRKRDGQWNWSLNITGQGFIAKPTTLDEMRTVVGRLLQEGQIK